MIRRTSNSIAQIPKPGLVLIGLAVVLLIGLVDYSTGHEVSVALFYLIPVGLVAWFVGRDAGMGMSFVSAVVWQLSNYLAGEVLSSPLFYVWNTSIRLASLFVVSILLHELQVTLANERKLSRIDSLTGAVNRRAFYDMAATELLQARRYKRPLTVAYIDVDDFKEINDLFGHGTGDALLRTVATTIKKSVRETKNPCEKPTQWRVSGEMSS